MNPCREQDLDALLADELSPEDAARVRTHVDACAACTHAQQWMRLERSWMAQRARRLPTRPALSFAALEARLAAAPARAVRFTPVRGSWTHWGKLALGAVAAVAVFGFSMAQVSATTSDDTWGRDMLVSASIGDICVDPAGEAVAALEARVGACLIASPALLLR